MPEMTPIDFQVIKARIRVKDAERSIQLFPSNPTIAHLAAAIKHLAEAVEMMEQRERQREH